MSRWEQAIRAAAKDDAALRKVRDGVQLSEEEEHTLADKLNRPEHYFNEENLRRAYRNPGGTLVDFIKHALGTAKVKGREEVVTEDFHAWPVSKHLTPDQAQYLTLLKNRGIVRGKVDVDDLFKPPLSILNAAALGVELFGEKGLQEIGTEMNEAVFRKGAA